MGVMEETLPLGHAEHFAGAEPSGLPPNSSIMCLLCTLCSSSSAAFYAGLNIRATEDHRSAFLHRCHAPEHVFAWTPARLL